MANPRSDRPSTTTTAPTTTGPTTTIAPTTTGPTGGTSHRDGRTARRDRNRLAVIDALFGLLGDGTLPSTEAIADRAGVSVSSVFRYFDSLDDLQRQTIDVHVARHGALFTIDDVGEGTRDDRIARYVDARIRLHDTVGPVARLARARSLEHGLIAEQLFVLREALATETRRHFAVELTTTTPATADDLVGLLDTMTSFEAWDLLTATHGRTARQIRRAWVRGIVALLDTIPD